MSGTTAVPAASLTDAGFVAPSEQLVLAGRQADINAALGGIVNPALNTPQGQIAVSDTAIIGDCNDQFLAVANGVDPATASGRMQDAIGYIYFLTRRPATATVVPAVCFTTGNAPIVLPANTPLAQDTAGNTYALPSAATIPASGNVAVEFACTTTGPIAVPAGALSIYQNVGGWTSVTNTEGVIGSNVESRSAFETRRGLTVAGNSAGANASVLGAVLAVPGVTDAYVVDNPTTAAKAIGGVTVAANSIYVVANGGAASAIALAIISKKAPGCGYTGGTTVQVADPNPLYSNPPQYGVSFDFATATPIYVAVTISNSTAVPSTALASIQAAIIAAFTGADGGPRYTIASTIYASRFYAGIAALGAWAQIVEITVGTAASPTGFTAPLDINQVPTVADGNVTLALQ